MSVYTRVTLEELSAWMAERGLPEPTAMEKLAAAIGADKCQILKDVDGVFTANPRVVPEAQKLDEISYDEMLEMAGAGSKVLALRSVEFARNHNVPIHVRSSFTWEPGTWVTSQERSMEDPIISGVVTDISEAKLTVVAVPALTQLELHVAFAEVSMQYS